MTCEATHAPPTEIGATVDGAVVLPEAHGEEVLDFRFVAAPQQDLTATTREVDLDLDSPPVASLKKTTPSVAIERAPACPANHIQRPGAKARRIRSTALRTLGTLAAISRRKGGEPTGTMVPRAVASSWGGT